MSWGGRRELILEIYMQHWAKHATGLEAGPPAGARQVFPNSAMISGLNSTDKYLKGPRQRQDWGAKGLVAGLPAMPVSLHADSRLVTWISLSHNLLMRLVEDAVEPELICQPSPLHLHPLPGCQGAQLLSKICAARPQSKLHSLRAAPIMSCSVASHTSTPCLPAEKRSVFNQHESTVFDNLVALIMDARKLQVRERFVSMRSKGLFPQLCFVLVIVRSVLLPHALSCC